MPIVYRQAQDADSALMYAFIFEHGQNPWNYLPEAGIRQHLSGLSHGETMGLLAFYGEKLVGLLTFCLNRGLSQWYSAGRSNQSYGYLAELVVHRDFTGQGIGTALTETVKAILVEQGVQIIFAERHEENIASARASQKAGFEVIATYYDPQRRQVGSRNTSVCYYMVDRARLHSAEEDAIVSLETWLPVSSPSCPPLSNS